MSIYVGSQFKLSMLTLTWSLLLMIQLGLCWNKQTRMTHSFVDGFWINHEFVFPDQLERMKKQARGFQTSAPRPSESLPSSTPSMEYPVENDSVVYPVDNDSVEDPMDNDSVEYPMDNDNIEDHMDNVFVPVGCSGPDDAAGYCENPWDYPDINVITALVKNKTTKVEADLIFGTPRTPERRQNLGVPLGLGQDRLPPDRSSITSNKKPVPENTIDTERRTYNDPNYDFDFIQEAPICDSIESFVYPRTARNLDKKWRFVINVKRNETGDEQYVQAVRVERCQREGRRCNIDSLTGSETVCRQKYTLRRLLVLSDNGQQYIDSFKFPSCCVCYEKKNFGIDQWGLQLRKREYIGLEGESASARQMRYKQYSHPKKHRSIIHTHRSHPINHIPPS